MLTASQRQSLLARASRILQHVVQAWSRPPFWTGCMRGFLWVPEDLSSALPGQACSSMMPVGCYGWLPTAKNVSLQGLDTPDSRQPNSTVLLIYGGRVARLHTGTEQPTSSGSVRPSAGWGNCSVEVPLRSLRPGTKNLAIKLMRKLWLASTMAWHAVRLLWHAGRLLWNKSSQCATFQCPPCMVPG